MTKKNALYYLNYWGFGDATLAEARRYVKRWAKKQDIKLNEKDLLRIHI